MSLPWNDIDVIGLGQKKVIVGKVYLTNCFSFLLAKSISTWLFKISSNVSLFLIKCALLLYHKTLVDHAIDELEGLSELLKR